MGKRQQRFEENNVTDIKNKFNDRFGIHDYTLSEEQKDLSWIIDNSKMILTHGRAGTGKSFAILHNFVKKYLQDKTQTITVIRNHIEIGDKIGHLPNGLDQKIEPTFIASREILENLLSKEKVKCDLNKRIHFSIPNFMLGRTLSGLVLIDEAQMIQPHVLKMLIERVSDDCTIVVCGDDTQVYTASGQRNGLKILTELLKKNPIEGVDFFSFSSKKNMRSDFVGRLNQVFENNEDFAKEFSA